MTGVLHIVGAELTLEAALRAVAFSAGAQAVAITPHEALHVDPSEPWPARTYDARVFSETWELHWIQSGLSPDPAPAGRAVWASEVPVELPAELAAERVSLVYSDVHDITSLRRGSFVRNDGGWSEWGDSETGVLRYPVTVPADWVARSAAAALRIRYYLGENHDAPGNVGVIFQRWLGIDVLPKPPALGGSDWVRQSA
jgi:hypothetical protein